MVTQFFISTNVKDSESKLLPQFLPTFDEVLDNLYVTIHCFSTNLANVDIEKLHNTFLKLLTVSEI
jgi:hypothetical protein